jgi:phosphate acetyltransferase
MVPNENVFKMISGLSMAGLSIVSVKDDTYTAALKVHSVGGELSKDDPEKINLAIQVVEKNVDFGRIYKLMGSAEANVTTPKMFQYRLVQKAKEDRRRIVLPEGVEPRIIRAAEEVLNKQICDLTLLGSEEVIQRQSQRIGADISRAAIVDPKKIDRKVIEEYAEALYQLRKHKSVTKEMALDLMVDPVYFATMMVYLGDADGFVSGSTHSTADTLGPVLRVIKTKPGVKLASSIFLMLMPNKVLVYGDCALIENPDAEQLAEIALTSSETAKLFGIDPIVAMLSYSTGESGSGRDVDKVREATQIVRKKQPDLPIEGPIQYDAAISEEVGKTKMQDSKVAGRATVFVFPDLDAGNTAYKAVQRSANVPAIGPILQGLAKPANDLSRGAQVVDIIYTIAVTAIQAQQIQAAPKPKLVGSRR